ncbi:hypothetical protein Slin15195_G054180 [Septoria linicola]|uniref:Rhodopsin domain-containing protein n=1 Tax=Septoria linicola TaxID=215465 RepID=A0A9Q9AMM2_9PEZI|nr:hypothetical protein Slin15195_G054180 [Septoria linicola]
MVLHGWASNTTVVAVCVMMPILAAFSVGMRAYARFLVQKNAGWDDCFILVSILFSIATTVTIIAQVETGLGKHMREISKPDAMRNQRDFFVMIIVYNISLTFTKLSILLQYKRLFPQKGFKMAVHIVMGAVVVYALWRFFSAIFTCSPVAAFWDHSIENSTCQNKFAIAMASTALNMASDLAIACLPLSVLHKLQLPSRQRYALMGVFALAGVVVVISILRLPSLVNLWKSKDISYQNPMVMVWSCIEINVGIICSCLPTLRCLFPKIFKAATGYASGRSGGSEGSQHGARSKRGRKSQGYAFVGSASGGQSSFGGKFSTKVSVSDISKGSEKASDKKDAHLLTSVEEIELASTKGSVAERQDSAGMGDGYGSGRGRIMVQTEIQQVESFKTMGSARDLARLERELV